MASLPANGPIEVPDETGSASQTSVSAFSRALDWFTGPTHGNSGGLRDRTHVFVVAHLGGLPLALGLLYILHTTVPSVDANLAWMGPAFFALCMMPFGLKLVPRLEVIAPISAQLFTLVTLVTAYYLGGLRSPALLWLMPAFATNLYYLASWPVLRAVNITIQALQVVAFGGLLHSGVLVRSSPPSDALLVLALASAIALVALNNVIVVRLWSSLRANNRELADEIAIRVATENRLRTKSDDLARAQKVGQMGSSTYDLETGTIVWSDEHYRLIGLDPALGGGNFDLYLSRVHPDDRQPLIEGIARCRRGETPEPAEYRVVLPSGEIRWMRRVVEIERDTVGRPVKLHTTATVITESRSLVDELRRKAEHLKRAQRIARIGSAELDLTTGEVLWSDGMFQLLGIEPDPAKANLANFMAAVHPEDRPTLEKLHRENERGSTNGLIEYRIVRPNGEVRWVRRGIEIAYDVSNNPIRLIATHQDISEAKRAEQEIRATKSVLRSIMDNTIDGLITIDERGTILTFNRPAEAMFGYSAAEAVGQNVKILVPSPHNDRHDAFITDYLSTGLAKIIGIGREVQGRRKDGTLFPMDLQVGEIRGAPEGHRFVGTVRDITELKRAEAALRKTEASLKEVQRLSQLGNWELDLTTNALKWSDEIFRIFEIDRDKFGASYDAFLDAIHPEDRDLVNRAYTDSVNNRTPYEITHRLMMKDGRVKFVQERCETFYDRTGRPVRSIGTVQDITQQKQMADERAALERQLVQAQKMETMGQLTGGIAHDFNNLLAVVLGRLQMVDEELADRPHLRSWVRSSIRAVERGATLTKSLLAFSRQQVLTPISLDLNALIDEMEEMLRRTLGEAYELRVSKAPDLWFASADPGQLQNALINLVINARDAMPDGGSLLIETTNENLTADNMGKHTDAEPGHYVMLSVSDTGIGMAPEVREQAFEPFFTTKDVGKGSGLGLSMVYGFAKQSGGHVSIFSELGRGTSVHLCLPRKIENVPATTTSIPNFEAAAGKGATILVVEDDNDLRDLTRLQLERLGYKVLAAADGGEGLRVLSENPEVDLLISDVILPHGMSGPAFVEKAITFRPDLKVVFVSGYSEDVGAFDRTHWPKPVRLLQKPFRVEELVAEIHAALN